MGLFKKGFSGFDRRTSGGKELGAETAGKWKSEDKTEYYYALTIEMK